MFYIGITIHDAYVLADNAWNEKMEAGLTRPQLNVNSLGVLTTGMDTYIVVRQIWGGMPGAPETLNLPG